MFLYVFLIYLISWYFLQYDFHHVIVLGWFILLVVA